MKNMWFVLSKRNNRTLCRLCQFLLGIADRVGSLAALWLQILQRNLNAFPIPTQTWTWWFSKRCCLGNLADPVWAFGWNQWSKSTFRVFSPASGTTPGCDPAFFPTLGCSSCLCSWFCRRGHRCGTSPFPSCFQESPRSAQPLKQGHRNIFVLWLFSTENCKPCGQRCFAGSPESWVSTFNFLSDTDSRGHETGLLL